MTLFTVLKYAVPIAAIALILLKMETTLRENDYKGGWENCSDEYLINRILEEWTELLKAKVLSRSREQIIDECADIANFAMMLADNYRLVGE